MLALEGPGAYLDVGLAILVLLYFLGACWFVLGTRRKNVTTDRVPMVSVVVAARNEAERIAGCLSALLAQDYPHKQYEVIVVDDGSTDDTAGIIGEYLDGPISVRLLQTEGLGSKKEALSLGIAEAKGDVILSTDADCLVSLGWISGMVAHFRDGVGFVIGYSQIGSASDIRTWRHGYEAVDFTSLMTCIWGSAGWGHPMAASGQNLGFLREVYSEVGGYDKIMHRASGDDVLLMQMVRNLHKWSIVFASDNSTFAQHPVTESWRALLRQRSRWASNATVLSGLDPLFFAYMLITYLLSILLLAAPVLLTVGLLSLPFFLGTIAVKTIAELVTFSCGVALSGRRELYRYFPFWVLLQTLHVVVVGSLGILGLFSWKGRNHRWGRRMENGA